jgi:hypothetical protein
MVCKSNDFEDITCNMALPAPYRLGSQIRIYAILMVSNLMVHNDIDTLAK